MIEWTLEELPWLNVLVIVVGLLTLVKASIRFTGVVLQTFVLPGTSVRVHTYKPAKECADDACHSSKSTERDRISGQVSNVNQLDVS